MTTIKAYTDLSQSRKLAEILPLESADMLYWKGEYITHSYMEGQHKDEQIPVWSLAALLGVLPTIDDEFEPQLHRSLDKYRCTYEGEEDSSGIFRVTDNPVDVCYDMILKLHELKML